MLAIPASVIIGGRCCGWLMGVSNPWTCRGWRWMLLIEGLVTVLMALVTYFVFVDKPTRCALAERRGEGMDRERRWPRSKATEAPAQSSVEDGSGRSASMAGGGRVVYDR